MDTIKSSADITVLFSQGRRFHTSGLTLIVLPTGDRSEVRSGRVAFIAGKKSGNAVWRNSAKRRLRALCHEVGGPWPGYDVLFLAKQPILNEAYDMVCKDLQHKIRQAGLNNVGRSSGKGAEAAQNRGADAVSQESQRESNE